MLYIEGIFYVTPAVARILAGQSALFEVAFNPDRDSSFFAIDLVGDVFAEQQEGRSEKETLVFPAITCVRLIGAFVLFLPLSLRLHNATNSIQLFAHRSLLPHFL